MRHTLAMTLLGLSRKAARFDITDDQRPVLCSCCIIFALKHPATVSMPLEMDSENGAELDVIRPLEDLHAMYLGAERCCSQRVATPAS